MLLPAYQETIHSYSYGHQSGACDIKQSIQTSRVPTPKFIADYIG